MGIDAHFYVKTDRDLTRVFHDMWYKTKAENYSDKIYVQKIPGGYSWYNLDRWYHKDYRRGYMPRLFIMFQVMNQNLEDGEHIYYVPDSHACGEVPSHDEPTTLEDMTELLLDWCAYMGLGHWYPEIRWDTEHPPDGFSEWRLTPNVRFDADAE